MKPTGLKLSHNLLRQNGEEVAIVGMAGYSTGSLQIALDYSLRIIYLEVDIGMTGETADWRLDNSWRREDGRRRECSFGKCIQPTTTHKPTISVVGSGS